MIVGMENRTDTTTAYYAESIATVSTTMDTDRTERAYDALRRALNRGADAAALEPADVDLLIAELVSLRHGRLSAHVTRGYQQHPATVTVITEHGGEIGIGTMTSRLDRDELSSWAEQTARAGLGLSTD